MVTFTTTYEDNNWYHSQITPVWPFSPCGPAAPVLPTGPTSPVRPGGPTGPGLPLLPFLPCTPGSPFSPENGFIQISEDKNAARQSNSSTKQSPLYTGYDLSTLPFCPNSVDKEICLLNFGSQHG